MIRLRLQRKGRKKRPYYHIVVADQRAPRDGRIIERLGRFDNVSEQKQLILDEERIIHWLKIGAQPTDTVRSLLKKEGILYKMHLLRWGKSEEEIEAALAGWKEERAASDAQKQLSRKERQKVQLEAEEKEYQKQLEQKAAEAAKQAEAKKAKAEEVAEASAPAAGETKPATEESQEPQAQAGAADEPEVKKQKEAEAPAPAAEESQPEPDAEETEESQEPQAQAGAADEPEVKKQEEAEAPAPAAGVSTDMTANEAIDHIRNTPLEELENFVPDEEDRVTVQRAWESKKTE